MKRSLLHDTASFFALYGIIFIPFPFYLTELQYALTETIFGKLISFISHTIFGKTLADSRIYSDSTSMYVLVLILFILAALTAFLLRLSKRWDVSQSRVRTIIYKICVYYLALQLLKYGVDKIFKNQFYLPEPNTLYTTMGNIPRDLLYWSSMGTSHVYSVFMGVLEIIAAGFLLFRRTRLTGLLITLVVMLNVVAVNFGFDIGVKLFSLFLLFLTLYLLKPYARNLYLFLTGRPIIQQVTASAEKRTIFLLTSKWFVIGLILFEGLFPFLRTGNFNGDLAERPYLHGAYEVNEMINEGDTLTASSLPLKRIYVHKQGYMIFQDQEDQMQDYKFSYDADHYKYVLTDYQKRKTPLTLTYNEKDSMLMMNYTKAGQPVQIKAKALDWRKLPAVKKSFHWTTD